jgi:hypothetical protein
VPRNLLLAGLVAFSLTNSLPSTYLGFLRYPPGIYIIYGLSACIVALLIADLPVFIRSLFRIPAVESDGNRLLVRGWRDQSFDIRNEHEIRIKDQASVGMIIVSSPDGPTAKIQLSQIEGPRSLVTFLKGLE